VIELSPVIVPYKAKVCLATVSSENSFTAISRPLLPISARKVASFNNRAMASASAAGFLGEPEARWFHAAQYLCNLEHQWLQWSAHLLRLQAAILALLLHHEREDKLPLLGAIDRALISDDPTIQQGYSRRKSVRTGCVLLQIVLERIPSIHWRQNSGLTC
jgi:hypothetical protein